ncbi:MAG: ATP-binding protein [Bacillota bacterium]
MPNWDFEDMDDPAWKEYSVKGERLKTTDKLTTAWFRIKLPSSQQWINPTIYFDGVLADDIVVYSNNKVLYKLNHTEVKQITNPFLAVHRFVSPLGDYGSNVLLIKTTSHSSYIGPRALVTIGSNINITRFLYEKEIDNTLLGFFLIAMGIFVIPIVVFLKKEERKTLLYLCFFIAALGTWLLTSTLNFNLLIFNNNSFRFYMSTVAKYSLVILIYLFLNQIFPSKSKAMKTIYKVIILLYILLLVAFVFVLFYVESIANLFDLAWYLLVAINLIMLSVVVFKNALKGNIDAKIFTIGFILFISIGVFETILYAISSIIPSIYKWGILIFIASLILILGRRFSEAHDKLIEYSAELENKNIVLNNTLEELQISKNEIEKLNASLEIRVIERTQELQEAMEKLVQTQEQLIQSEKMAALGGLVAGIAHEINTPVGIGVTAASHLDKETNEVDELYKNNRIKKSDFESFISTCRELTDVILTNLRNASELIKSFKKVAVDQSSEEKRVFNVKEYINEILLSLSPEIKKTKHNIKVNCSDDIELDGYAGAFSQIISNLVMNTIIHAYEPDQQGNITIDVEKQNDKIIIKYSDEGKGIEKENLSRIFEPFFTTKRNSGGTGLGLNVVYNIVTQKFNGNVKCISEIGQGTLFSVEIPI